MKITRLTKLRARTRQEVKALVKENIIIRSKNRYDAMYNESSAKFRHDVRKYQYGKTKAPWDIDYEQYGK